jgi:hypothetical protein
MLLIRDIRFSQAFLDLELHNNGDPNPLPLPRHASYFTGLEGHGIHRS